MRELQHLIEKFWRGKATAAERNKLMRDLELHGREFEEWLKQSYSSRELPDNAHRLHPERTSILLEKIHKRIAAQNKPRVWWKAQHYRLGFAAAILLLVVAGICWQVKYIKIARQPASSLEDSRSFIRIDTENKGKLLTLPDSSIIWLAPGSTILYTGDFGHSKREIILKGKARFDVAKKVDAPFVVSADGYTVTALGTAFIVQTNMEDNMSVKLLSGKVLVKTTPVSRSSFSEILLNPGDELQINVRNGQFKMLETLPPHTADKNEIKGRQTDIHPAETLVLHFDETPLTTVFEQLATICKQDFVYNPADLSGLIFTGRLPLGHANSTGLLNVLSKLCQEYGLVYSEQHGKIVINKKTN